MISIKDFQKVDMKVGKVLSADCHPDADKLVVLRADMGKETPRTLVAALKGHYETEQLVGRLIVAVTNLEPARLRGIESHGMLLAAQEADRVVLVTPDKEVAPGSPVL